MFPLRSEAIGARQRPGSPHDRFPAHARPFVGVFKSQVLRDLVIFYRQKSFPAKWLKERQDGSKNDVGMPSRRASRGVGSGRPPAETRRRYGFRRNVFRRNGFRMRCGDSRRPRVLTSPPHRGRLHKAQQHVLFDAFANLLVTRFLSLASLSLGGGDVGIAGVHGS